MRHLDSSAKGFVAVFNGEPWSEAWTLGTASTYLRDLLDTPRSLGVVAEDKGEVIGFALGHIEQRDRDR